jgi:hypothetical protein
MILLLLFIPCLAADGLWYNIAEECCNMGDQIEFPKNYGTYMHHALSALQDSDYERAITHMKKAYAIKDENSLNILLVSTLFQNGQVNEALDYAEEKESFYLTNEKRLLVYIELLIYNYQFLLAQKLLDDEVRSATSENLASWQTLRDTLEQKKLEAEKERQQTEIERMKKLFSLASLTPDEQFAMIQEADEMKTDNLIQAAPSVFQNPYVHPFARSGLLSVLIDRKVNQSFSYTWLNEDREVIPASMSTFEDHPVVLDTYSEIEESFISNPSLKVLVEQEVKAVLLMLFPFIDEVIQKEDISAWIYTIAEGIQLEQDAVVQVSEEKQAYIKSWVSRVYQELL